MKKIMAIAFFISSVNMNVFCYEKPEVAEVTEVTEEFEQEEESVSCSSDPFAPCH